jgi:Mrp family chromosome partitioning ATPase
MAMAVGAALGLGIVMIRRLMSRTFRDIEALERATGQPVVTVIPEQRWAGTRAALDEVVCNPTGHAAESIRALRNHINSGAPDALSRAVSLMSPFQNDGKTTATLMLARLAALAEEHVVVLDLDLRQDTVARELGLGRRRGVGAVLRGETQLSRVIHSDPDLEFDIVPAGDASPADSPGLGALQSILADLTEEYDLVLINAPALLQAPESAVIAQAVDQCMLLVRWDVTEQSAMRRALSVLRGVGAPLDGVALTRADVSRVPDGHLFSYGYV